MTATLKKISFISALFAWVLFVNKPILTFDMMYFEQPLLYLVNQKITSWWALLNVYLHPQVLAVISIPFFRPSGHFLLYHLLTPWLGWHNTRGFLLVNFFFLTLTGCMMIKLYSALFPRYRVGGYIAFAFFLMHPALMLSRLSPMHFEFANMFFILLGLYSFIQFCKVRERPMPWLLLTLSAYFIAVTFKETALMLGPVLVLYALIMRKTLRFSPREFYQTVALITVFTFILTVYLTMQWPHLMPLNYAGSTWQVLPAVINKLIRLMFGLPFNVVPHATPFVNKYVLWELLSFPNLSRVLVWLFLILTVSSCFLRFHLPRRAVGFLALTAGAFLLLPIVWHHAMPWHLGLTLIFVCLLFGFGFEHTLTYFLGASPWLRWAGYVSAIIIALTAVSVTAANIQLIQQDPRGFSLRLDRNAVLHPPALSAQLNSESVLVVEDSFIHNDYYLGDSTYPYIWLGKYDLIRNEKLPASYPFPYVYGGTLFRWAYLQPDLKEQVYPFSIAKMSEVPDDEIIYNWLQHYNNIFCVGYDEQGMWHDRTAEFKANLLTEKIRRHLLVNPYATKTALGLQGKILTVNQFEIPDSSLCKMRCDKMHACKGFTYMNVTSVAASLSQCIFYKELSTVGKPCAACTAYIKEIV